MRLGWERGGRATADTLWLAYGRPLYVARLRRLELSRGGASVERGWLWVRASAREWAC